jgi:hypothetical protein
MNIVVVNFNNDNVGVFFECSDKSFLNQKIFIISFKSQSYTIPMVDFNNDTLVYVIVTNSSGSFLALMAFSTGDESSLFSVSVSNFSSNDRNCILSCPTGIQLMLARSFQCPLNILNLFCKFVFLIDHLLLYVDMNYSYLKVNVSNSNSFASDVNHFFFY